MRRMKMSHAIGIGATVFSVVVVLGCTLFL